MFTQNCIKSLAGGALIILLLTLSNCVGSHKPEVKFKAVYTSPERKMIEKATEIMNKDRGY